MQLWIGMGYLALGHDLLSLLRVLLVNTTTPAPSTNDIPLVVAWKPSLTSPDTEMSVDDGLYLRRLYRRSTDVLGLFFIAAMVTGGVGDGGFSAGLKGASGATRVFILRSVMAI